jgi:hypothetical protein
MINQAECSAARTLTYRGKMPLPLINLQKITSVPYNFLPKVVGVASSHEILPRI